MRARRAAMRDAASQHALRSTRRVLLIAILLVAFGLRCRGLDVQELRGDEAFGYFLSLKPLRSIVDQTLDLREPHPVASYWLQHLWLNIGGHSEFALRFSGVWWSMLAVALIVPLAALLALPNAAGMLAAVLMALSPYAIWHAQDARMYSMSLALTTASTLTVVPWWRAGTNRARLGYACAYLLVTWLALHTHYFAVYIVVAQHIALFGWGIVARAWRKMMLWWAIGIVLLLLWLPWLWAARVILLAYRGNGDSPGLIDAIIRAHGAFGVGESVSGDVRLLWALLTLGLIVLGGSVLWRMPKTAGRATLWFLVVYWLTPLVATWVSALNRPIFNERYLVAAVPPVYLLMAAVAGQTRLRQEVRWRVWLARGGIALVMGMMMVGLVRQVSDPRLSKTRGWRELAAALGHLVTGVDAANVRLVQNYPDPTLWYYYQGDVPHLVLPPAAHDETLAQVEVEQIAVDGVGRVVLVEQPADAWDNRGIARAALREEYTFAGQIVVANWPVSIWLRPPADLEPFQVEYEGGLALRGARVFPVRVVPGGIVEVYLQWQADADSVGAQEAVSVQLLDAAGTLVAQSDRPLEMASMTTVQVRSYVILLPMDLATGDYALDVVVYDPSRDGAPRRLTIGGDDSVPVSNVVVVDAE